MDRRVVAGLFSSDGRLFGESREKKGGRWQANENFTVGDSENSVQCVRRKVKVMSIIVMERKNCLVAENREERHGTRNARSPSSLGVKSQDLLANPPRGGRGTLHALSQKRKMRKKNARKKKRCAGLSCPPHSVIKTCTESPAPLPKILV